MQIEHPDDQTVVGVYVVEHSPQRKEYRLIGTKRRTGGNVVLATFTYRTNSQKLYLPTQAQALAIANLLQSHINSYRVVLKDGR